MKTIFAMALVIASSSMAFAQIMNGPGPNGPNGPNGPGGFGRVCNLNLPEVACQTPVARNQCDLLNNKQGFVRSDYGYLRAMRGSKVKINTVQAGNIVRDILFIAVLNRDPQNPQIDPAQIPAWTNDRKGHDIDYLIQMAWDFVQSSEFQSKLSESNFRSGLLNRLAAASSQSLLGNPRDFGYSKQQSTCMIDNNLRIELLVTKAILLKLGKDPRSYLGADTF
jgi:hypothetical protein